jgi:hypothetical protein
MISFVLAHVVLLAVISGVFIAAIGAITTVLFGRG